MATIGENIKRIRKEKGLTQKQLAELCNSPMADSAIRRYESNTAKPKFENIKRIACALEVSFSDLVPIDEITVQRIGKGGTLTTIGKGKGGIRLVKEEDQKKYKIFLESAPNGRYKKTLLLLNRLTLSGQNKAIELLELLTKIPEYQKKEE